MYKPIKSHGLLAAVLCTAFAGCASVEPVAYSGLASASYLKHDLNDKSGRVPYSFSTDVDWHKYTKLIFDPVVVYRGSDNQFGEMSERDRASLAKFAEAKFTEKLRTRFDLTKVPSQDTLRVKMTLTGASTTTAVIGPLSRFDIAGGLYNGVQTVRGREGAFTGSVTYAVEIYDASTDRLLRAYVTKQYPSPYNIGASFGSLSASETGIEKGADSLVAQLR